ncbi:MAG: hypothetical protein ABSA26_12275 [Thermoguttaceae bacterium]
MWKSYLAALVLLAANIAYGQEFLQSIPGVLQYEAAPYTFSTLLPEPLVNNSGDKFAHLMQAAEHLEAAGLNDDAKRIRQMAAGEKSPIVLVQISAVEVSLTKLDKLGFDISKITPGDSSSAAVKVLDASGQAVLLGHSSPFGGGSTSAMLKADDRYFSVLKELIKDKIAKVITAPTIAAESGRTASIHIGGQIPMPSPQNSGNSLVEYKDYGTKIDVVPVVVDEETIHLEIRGSISKLDEKHSAKIAGTTVPGISCTSIDTACNIKNGYIMVLGGLVERRVVENTADASGTDKDKKSDVKQVQAIETSERVALMFLVTAEILDPNTHTATKPRPSPLLK